jgi:methylamine dehydrogenase accessory protein MauD
MEGWWAASYVLLWALVVLLTIAVVALARQIGTLHLRLGPRGALELDDEGPELGSALPPTEATDVDDRPVVIGGPGAAQMLMFVSPGCMVCERVLPSVPVVADMGHLTPFVVTDVDAEETKLTYSKKKLNAQLIPGRDLVARLGVPGTPYVVITDRQGIVRAKGTVNNLEQMEGLVDSARRRTTEGIDA